MPSSLCVDFSYGFDSVAGNNGYIKVFIELEVVLPVPALCVIDFRSSCWPQSPFSILPPVQPQAANAALIFSASAGVTAVSARTAEVLAMIPAATRAITIRMSFISILLRLVCVSPPPNGASVMSQISRFKPSGFQIAHERNYSRVSLLLNGLNGHRAPAQSDFRITAIRPSITDVVLRRHEPERIVERNVTSPTLRNRGRRLILRVE